MLDNRFSATQSEAEYVSVIPSTSAFYSGEWEWEIRLMFARLVSLAYTAKEKDYNDSHFTLHEPQIMMVPCCSETSQLQVKQHSLYKHEQYYLECNLISADTHAISMSDSHNISRSDWSRNYKMFIIKARLCRVNLALKII